MAGLQATHRWKLPKPLDPAVVARLAAETETPRLAVELLLRRGFGTAPEVRSFLEPSAGLLRRPDALPDIAPATKRILQALERRETILVSGDYDVDGVTSTALLVLMLRQLGADVHWFVPSRELDGYGFPQRAVEAARSSGARLIITVDCGSSDAATVAAARSAGIDVIVTDHHELPESAAPATCGCLALVNPKRGDSAYPFRELAGVGVAFKLAWSVLSALGRRRDELTDLLDLVGLGTIADVVPLVDENRIIARLGLLAIRHSRRPGIRALLEQGGIGSRPLTSYHVGFILAPRINAAGRVGSADKAVRLLLTSDQDEATAIARELGEFNRSRQSLEDAVLKQALAALDNQNPAGSRAIVVAGSGWHEGVIGIVAARLAERLWRPCIVVSAKPERSRGSGRSISGFDLHAALRACSGHLQGYGGHRYAAGLSIAPASIDRFRAALDEFAQGFPAAVFEPTLHIDAVADIDSVNSDLLRVLERFEPFGPDNPTPVFASLAVEVVGYPRRIGTDHLKLRVRGKSQVHEAVAWGRSRDLLHLAGGGSRLDICYTVDRRIYAGRETMQLTLRDLRAAEPVPGQ